ncbi:hypothetical protein EMCG_01646 [[Emmonsia] crescens]|uniref:DNA 3'-5' helicase n=1 Tax=[Emmonsia] crescens TaxID=73230 RepID=A0A0G2J2E6_9EURO|nr:hypothetical protein EMCG_01646 [Emmonsia crescens UAMH 3008]
MGLLSLLRELECPMVFLTSTLPLLLVVQFERTMLLRGACMVRSFIMCRDISLSDIAEETAQAIECLVYHFMSGSAAEKVEMLQCWQDGDPAHIMATSVFDLGIDHPAVRWVVHVGVPCSMIDFAQEIGRLGRDGAGGQSLILVPS